MGIIHLLLLRGDAQLRRKDDHGFPPATPSGSAATRGLRGRGSARRRPRFGESTCGPFSDVLLFALLPSSKISPE